MVPRQSRRCRLLLLALVVCALIQYLAPFREKRFERLRGGRPSKPSDVFKAPQNRPKTLKEKIIHYAKKPSTYIALGLLYYLLSPVPEDDQNVIIDVPYSTFLDLLEMGNKTHPAVDNVEMASDRWSFDLNGIPAETIPVPASNDVIDSMKNRGITFGARDESIGSGGMLLSMLFNGALMLAPFVLDNKFNRGLMDSNIGERVMLNDTHFCDLQGMDKPKREVAELVHILKDPKRFIKAGVRLPKGILLVGPPGTGKTMLARALAAEAQVPFFSTSGADFVEVFAGRGAARVRSLFKMATKHAPALIFIDELDAVGKTRSQVRLGGSEEMEQTLNMLLAAMDGLTTKNNGVMVMAATNRLDVLDPALVRPGRFDRVVRVTLPDMYGRASIIRHYCRKLTLGPDVDIESLAERTEGFAGADIECIINEAAIRSVRRNSSFAVMADFDDALFSYLSTRSRKRSPEPTKKLSPYYTEMATEEQVESEEGGRGQLNEAEESLRRLERLVSDLKYFSTKSGQQEPSSSNAAGGGMRGWLFQKLFGGSPEEGENGVDPSAQENNTNVEEMANAPANGGL